MSLPLLFLKLTDVIIMHRPDATSLFRGQKLDARDKKLSL